MSLSKRKENISCLESSFFPLLSPFKLLEWLVCANAVNVYRCFEKLTQLSIMLFSKQFMQCHRDHINEVSHQLNQDTICVRNLNLSWDFCQEIQHFLCCAFQ